MRLIHKIKQLFFPKKRRVLFYRDFHGLTGGHLKVWHYFQHVNTSEHYRAEIYFTPSSTWEDNPWINIKNECLLQWYPQEGDILFMEGLDWQAFPEDKVNPLNLPVINLIQGFRHVNPNNLRYSFLKYKATRICVSPEVSTALKQIPIVNGLIFDNPNGLDKEQLPCLISYSEKNTDLLIVGVKEPLLAEELMRKVRGLHPDLKSIELLTQKVPREQFLEHINSSKISIFLASFEDKEGFYLPALEGMALKTLVICPDCLGNRSFCLPSVNCFRPEYQIDAILNDLMHALELSENERQRLLDNAQVTVNRHTIEYERDMFLSILEKCS